MSAVVLTSRNWPNIPRWATRTRPPVSRSMRYFPRRATSVKRTPDSGSSNSLRRAWRRTMRIALRVLRTSAARIFLPTTSLSRSRRTISTSGSSGIPLLELRQGAFGGRLLRLLLRPAGPLAQKLADEEDLRVEALGVVGAARGDPVLGDGTALADGPLLQAGLEVAHDAALDMVADVLC